MFKAPKADEIRKRAIRLFEDGEIGEETEGSFKKEASFKTEGSRKTKTDSETNSKSKKGFSREAMLDSEEDFENEIKKSSKKTAKEYAMLLVSSHTYTEKALKTKLLARKIYSQDDIEDAVEYVKKFGYVNDMRLAQDSIQRLAERGYGKSKICRYFASKGISEDTIDSLDFSEIDFAYYCKRLMDKYKDKPHDKMMRALLNAGYSYDDISCAKEYGCDDIF